VLPATGPYDEDGHSTLHGRASRRGELRNVRVCELWCEENGDSYDLNVAHPEESANSPVIVRVLQSPSAKGAKETVYFKRR